MKLRRSLLLPGIVPGVLLVGWELSVRAGFWPPSLIASPTVVGARFLELVVNGVALEHASISLGRLAAGMALGAGAGFLTGCLVALYRTTELLLAGTISVLAPVPVIAWTPILIVLLGIGGARIGLIAVGSFFLLYFATLQGIRSVDQRYVELASIYRKSTVELLKEVLLPGALPSILDSLRTTLAIAWILLLAAEIIASSSGVGWLIWDSRNFARPADMLVGMILVGVLGKLSDAAVVGLSRKLLRWRRTFQGIAAE